MTTTRCGFPMVKNWARSDECHGTNTPMEQIGTHIAQYQCEPYKSAHYRCKTQGTVRKMDENHVENHTPMKPREMTRLGTWN